MIAAIATSLEPEVYLPGEFVVVAGCVSRAMYFISRGKVQLMKRDESRNLTAEEVLQFFNELALFSVSTKTTSLSARSLTHCDLYSLHKRDFDRIMRDFPGPAMKMADAMLAYARKAEECLDDDIVFDYSIKDAKVICKAVYEIVGKPELMPNLSIVVKSLLKPRIKKLLKMMRESPQPDWIAQRVGKEHYSPDARADFERSFAAADAEMRARFRARLRPVRTGGGSSCTAAWPAARPARRTASCAAVCTTSCRKAARI